ncbi:MAG: TVP38/TMEM64 family protein [Deinococcota bacterium]
MDSLEQQEGQVAAQPSFWQAHGQKVGAGIFWLILIGIYAWYSITNNVGPRETLVRLVQFMQQSAYGPLIYILVYALRPLVLFSAVILTLAGGYLFGPILGVVFVILGSNAGASLAYLIGRFFGGDDLLNQADGQEDGDKAEQQGFVARWLQPLRENSFETVLIMRFIFLPYDLVNYLAGFLKVNYLAFLVATVVGSLPGTLAFTLAGASIEGDFTGGIPSLNRGVLIASVVIFIASLAFSNLLKKRRARQSQQPQVEMAASQTPNPTASGRTS